MASITQTVASYTGGISQQPDEMKIPGQVNKAQNVYPDVTYGLQKRPGGRLVASISDSGTLTIPGGTNYDPDASATARWFSYYRDEAEQYIGQVNRTGEIRMWKCSDGSPVPVIYDQGTGREAAQKLYLNHYEDNDIQTLTLNDHTYITNRASKKNDGSTHPKTTTAMTALTEPIGYWGKQLFIDLLKISYSSQYALNLFDDADLVSYHTATRIEVDRVRDSKNSCAHAAGNNGAGTAITAGDWPPSGTQPGTTGDGAVNWNGHCRKVAGDKQDSYCPAVETKIFSIDAGVTYSASSDEGDDANGTTWSTTVYDTNNNNAVVSGHGGKNLYFRISTTGQSVAEGDNTQNPNYHCRYTTTHDLLYGGEGWEEGERIYVWMNGAQYAVTIKSSSHIRVQATMDGTGATGLIRPEPTPFDNSQTITAESILGDIRTIIGQYSNGITVNDTNLINDSPAGTNQAKLIGTGLYIVDTADFNGSTPNGTLMNIIQKTVDDVESLPQQCRHGYIVKVKNTESDEDDWYVRFSGENDKDGKGTWDECPEPGRKIEFDKDTMPIDLVRRQDDGSGTKTGTAGAIYFSVENPAWENCTCGSWDAATETGTVPEPSFIGKKIMNMMLFRNRLVLLSGESVIMSRPGAFFDFWPRTAVTYSVTDPIDLSVGSAYPADIFDAVQVNSGLLLFTKNQQFLLTTDSDILNPQTAKINALATFNYNHKVSPISLGTTVGWLDNAGKYSRFFEIAKVQREGEPDVIEQSKIVGDLFNNELDHISISRENGIIFFSEKNTPTIYAFKYFNAPQKRIQQSWFTWELSGDIQYHAMLDDSLYAVVKNNDKFAIQKFDIKLQDGSRTVVDDKQTATAADDVTFRVHLDINAIVASSAITYNATTNKTTFTLPAGFNNSSAQLAVYVVPTTADDTFQGMTDNATLNGSTVELTGNWKTYLEDQNTPQTPHDPSDDTTVTPTNNLYLGYLFDYEVEFPTIHVTRQEGESWRSDTRSSLIIHRAKLSLGVSGLYETTLKRTGKPDYVETYEPVMADAYSANQIQFTAESVRTVPIYDRNTNATLILKSTHASPATLHSMTWEGDYNTKFYQRV